ncbi:MAG: glutamate racemase [Rhodospirillaceae bacterium]|nr:glutamate racemase [Rhodospirillaceae bacterium]
MIGAFDSGHGGLTILRALTAHLPERSFLYFGDHAHMPYGERSADEILQLTEAAITLLFERGCRLVLLACNTAAAVALRTLQQQWLPAHYPDRRILGVLVPTVEIATGIPWAETTPRNAHNVNRSIAIFATRRTVASNVYVEEIRKRAPHITVVQQACPGLVSLIEQSAPRAELRDAVQGHVRALMAQMNGAMPDSVILGCTHYPLVADLFTEMLPAGCEVLSQPDLVARSLIDYLKRHPEIDTATPAPSTRFLTSGDPDTASHFATVFFGRPVQFQSVPLKAIV